MPLIKLRGGMSVAIAIVKKTIGSRKISSLAALSLWPAFLDELSPFQSFFFSKILFPEV
jgi:hypothetical protein